MAISQLTDADLQPYLATSLTALYGFDTSQKLRSLASLAMATEATYLPQDMGHVAVVGGEAEPVELPPEMFDPVGGCVPELSWETRRMTLVDAVDWWKARLGHHADQSSYLTSLLMIGLVSSAPVLAVEHVERDLHPKIQAGLADFLVSLVRMGKRVIIDTHSIPIFDRLRVWRLWDPSLQEKIGVWVDGKPVDYEAMQFPLALSDFGLHDECRVGLLTRSPRRVG